AGPKRRISGTRIPGAVARSRSTPQPDVSAVPATPSGGTSTPRMSASDHPSANSMKSRLPTPGRMSAAVSASAMYRDVETIYWRISSSSFSPEQERRQLLSRAQPSLASCRKRVELRVLDRDARRGGERLDDVRVTTREPAGLLREIEVAEDLVPDADRG